MIEPIDVQAEFARWSATGLPRDTMREALDHLIGVAREALAEERRLAASLRRELAYSLCWPDAVGEQTLVSRAYSLMGPTRFPTPGDPEPVRASLVACEEQAAALAALIEQATALQALIAE